MIPIKLLNFKAFYLGLIIISSVSSQIPKFNQPSSLLRNISKNNIKLFMDTLGNITPETLFSDSIAADISPKCRGALDEFLKLDSLWAWKMLDAWGKLPSGAIFYCNANNLGSYEECLSIKNIQITIQTDEGEENEVINGNYCLGTVFSHIIAYSGICVPDSCTASDLNRITRPKLPLIFIEEQCHSPAKDPEIDAGDIAVITFFAIIGGLMLLSSLYDCYLRKYEQKAAHPILLAFSVVTNGEKLFSTKQSSDQMECISGIRFISMMWVVLGHSVSNLSFMPLTDNRKNTEFFEEPGTKFIRAAALSVDTFFLLAGIVIVYVHLNAITKPFNILIFYLHRYLRITPALAVVLVVHLTVLKHFGGGPFWYMMDFFCFENCRQYWWGSLLHIQNFTNAVTVCMWQTWYLSCDMQMFLVSPIFLLLLKKSPKLALLLMAGAGLVSMFAGFGVAWGYNLFDTAANKLLYLDMNMHLMYNEKYYNQSYMRAPPYFIGMILGYFLYQIKMGSMKIKIKTFVNYGLWACSIAVMATCVFYDVAQVTEYDQFAMSAYIAFLRPAWAVGVAWVIFACITGHGGPINAFLSMPSFQVLARFTYSMYITHYTINLVILSSTKVPLPFSIARILFDYWSLFCLVFFVSVFWTMAFEAPIVNIEKLLLGRNNESKKQEVLPKKPDKTEQTPTVIAMDTGVEYNTGSNIHHRVLHGVINSGYDENKNGNENEVKENE